MAAPSLWPQQSLKAEAQALEGSPTQLPILADMLLYYCRFAARPVLLQVYQTEVRPPCPAPPLPHLPGLQGPTPAPGEPAGLCWRSQMGPSRRFTLMYMLLPSPADLHHWGEDDRDLHPLLGAGSLRCHTCHQGVRWVLPEQRQTGRRGLGRETWSSVEVGLPGRWGHGKVGLHRR